MAKHIGIVAASPEGTALCYKLVGRRAAEVEDAERRPEVSLHNKPFSTYVDLLTRGDWEGIAGMLADSAAALSAAGADFCILPDNALHHAVPMAQVRSPIPFLSMIDLLADAVHGDGLRTVGLIGTKFVTNGSTYQAALGLRGMRLLVPEEGEVELIDRVIFREAVYGRVAADSRASVLGSVSRLADRGCEALVLGCSEAAYLFDPADAALPVFDPVELLAEEAVRHAAGE